MIAACLTAAAALPAFLCTPGEPPPPPPPARVVAVDRGVRLPVLLPPLEPEPEPRVVEIDRPHVHAEPEPGPEPEPISDVWYALAVCESGQGGTPRWDYNGGSGFDGGLQFHPGTWSAYAPSGHPAYAWQATPAQQIEVAERVLAVQGWGAWPACSSKLGLR